MYACNPQDLDKMDAMFSYLLLYIVSNIKYCNPTKHEFLFRYFISELSFGKYGTIWLKTRLFHSMYATRVDVLKH